MSLVTVSPIIVIDACRYNIDTILSARIRVCIENVSASPVDIDRGSGETIARKVDVCSTIRLDHAGGAPVRVFEVYGAARAAYIGGNRLSGTPSDGGAGDSRRSTGRTTQRERAFWRREVNHCSPDVNRLARPVCVMSNTADPDP